MLSILMTWVKGDVLWFLFDPLQRQLSFTNSRTLQMRVIGLNDVADGDKSLYITISMNVSSLRSNPFSQVELRPMMAAERDNLPSLPS
jgi:hypothetical protein